MARGSQGAGACLAAGLVLWPIGEAGATDTVETFNVGRSDAEIYLYLGFGRQRPFESFAGEWVAGYGVSPAFSIFVSSRVTTSRSHLPPIGNFALGLFGTAVDTRHFDLDIGLTAAGPRPAELQAIPNIELNFDAEDALAWWGMYARAELPIAVLRSHAEHGGPQAISVSADLDVTLGTYVSVRPGQQLLLEHRVSLPAEGPETVTVALGYNIVVSDVFELLSEAAVVLPQGRRPPGYVVMFGFVASLPACEARCG